MLQQEQLDWDHLVTMSQPRCQKLVSSIRSLACVSSNDLFVNYLPAPSSAPRNVEATIIGPTVANLSWDAPLQADQNGIIHQYHINITEVDTARQWTLISMTNTYLLNFLRPHHTYLYSIAAVTISSGPYTQLFNFTVTPESELIESHVQIEKSSYVDHCICVSIIFLFSNAQFHSEENGSLVPRPRPAIFRSHAGRVWEWG